MTLCWRKKMKQNNGNDQAKADFKDEFKLLYSLCVSDIAFSKNQQWKVTNYVVAIYVALFGIWKAIVIENLKRHFGIEFYLFLLIGGITLIIGILLIQIDQGLLKRSRARINKIVDNFSDEFRSAFRPIAPPKRNLNALSVFTAQISVIILGYVFLAYSLIRLPLPK
jgi:hypothetical protein